MYIEGCDEDSYIFSFLSLLDTLYLVHQSCDHLTYIVLIFDFYTHVSYLSYAIHYFCFILRCHDEFCLTYFRNTGCQSLFAINSLFAKSFKSLC